MSESVTSAAPGSVDAPQPSVGVPERLVIVVNEALAPGHLANAAAVAGLIVGAKMPYLLGADLADADGVKHTGIYTTGLPILRATATTLARLRSQAGERGLGICEFPALAQTTNSYEELTALVARTKTENLTCAALAIFGPKKAVNRLTGSLPLLR
ncbi:DUF2000 domain-containing protein [Streptomyces sp. NPDC090493]|uniref:DUF2000 domain-containing protein n=1 Tax=Streptomyces sp. NPDC090493 TaxID=3365964 RepID=UPI0037FCC29E